MNYFMLRNPKQAYWIDIKDYQKDEVEHAKRKVGGEISSETNSKNYTIAFDKKPEEVQVVHL